MNKLTLIVLCLLATIVSPLQGQDVRRAAQKAEKDRKEALERARQIEERIFNDRAALIAQVEKFETRERQLEGEINSLGKRGKELELLLEKLEEKWSRREMETKEISGNIRVVGRDLQTLVEQSPYTALVPKRLDRIRAILRKGYFPGIDDISIMTDLFFDEIERSGQVGLSEAAYVGRNGEDRTSRILTLGKFTSFYEDGTEVGFLRYSPAGNRFFALSALPSRRLRGSIQKYLAGKSDEIVIDISSGAALRQVVHKTSFVDQLKAGGPLVWPIGAVALAAIIIIIYKILLLNQVRKNTGKYMTRVNRLASEGNWAECEDIVRRHKGEHSPVNHVIEAGLQARTE
ncbi:MAG: hypothetical protein JXB45_06645, partial [Candidatus Krumholzibacteriota bacterium]|nr:hypothetical protein [Candidatus Krumholzibacteriota bacterium]